MQDDNDGRVEGSPSPSRELGLSPRRPEPALGRILRLLAHALNTSSAAFWVTDGDAAGVVAACGEFGAHASPIFARQTLKQGGLLAVEDTRADLRFAAEAVGSTLPRFYAGVPIHGRDRCVLGVLGVLDAAARRVEVEAIATLEAFGALVEDHLHLRADAQHDPQTGLFARRPYEAIADREWRRAVRGIQPVSVIMAALDRIDDFRAEEGEDALAHGMRAAALAMQYSLHRPGDVVCRYDDTRFAVLLPNTDERGVEEAAERIRAAIEALQIPFRSATVGVLTLSQGIETVHSERLSRCGPAQAAFAATKALQQAQREGGNRWALYGYLDDLDLPAR